ncbi:Fe-S cluster assembly ATPase SufC [Candidatus Nomurabacteria bacterium]|nr:Fe-S cluster assembly ATPase SufC [Candidatus Nomurabacteria bacterium]
MANLLKIKNLSISVLEKNILQDLDLEIKAGETHVVMGPNGAGKSTLANVLLGHPSLLINDGEIVFAGEKINDLKPEERAVLGLFLSWQNPPEIEGVSLDQFLYQAYQNIFKGRNKDWQVPTVFEFEEILKEQVKKLKIKEELLKRSLNFGFSGGEKKKIEMLQLALFQPKLAILDETDSGLDIDALKIVASSIKDYQQKKGTILLITHYPQILEFIKPDFVHVLVAGKIVKSGGQELAKEINQKGFLGYVR